tara:strand:- start:2964 stop:4112 length:1149 start_codon:yes stop_codon:yes gene_type:complete
MFGGELLATGSSSCVFNPNFPCKKNGVIDDERISKIIYNPGAREESQHEKKMNEEIKKIRGYSSWAIIFDQFCKPFPKDVLSTYDKRGMDNCLDEEYEDLVDDFDENSYMMNGIYGGETFDDYFMKMFEYKKMSVTQRDKQFLKLMNMMEPLFLGLKKMDEKNIIHNDIKPNNIVVHDGVFKYIDFGLAGQLSDKNHFRERSLDELRSDRIYMYYPLEYLLYYATRKQLEDEIQRINTNYVRKNYDLLSNVHYIYGRDITTIYYDTVYQLRNKKVNQTKMLKSIDTYSLGILIPMLFLRSEVFEAVQQESQLMDDFYTLFGMMTSPLSHSITAETAYKQFKQLLNKYKKYGKKTPVKRRTKARKKKNMIKRKMKKKRTNRRK